MSETSANKHDWDALEVAYRTSQHTLKELAFTFDVPLGTLKYHAAKKDDEGLSWSKKRERWRKEQFEKLLEEQSAEFRTTANEVETSLLGELQLLISELHLAALEVAETRIALGPRVLLLKDLTTALQTAVKTQRLITGRSTENVDVHEPLRDIFEKCGIGMPHASRRGDGGDVVALEPQRSH